MTSKRAFWEAVGVVCIPTLAIWGVLLYALRGKIGSDWPAFLIFGGLPPLVLIYPIYKAHLRGKTFSRQPSAKLQFLMGGLWVVLGSGRMADSLLHSSPLLELLIGISWFLVGIVYLIRAVKAKKESSTTPMTT